LIMKTVKKTLSTFEREMRKPAFKKKFEHSYKNFLLSELIIMLMENDALHARFYNFFVSISHACGYHLMLKKGKENITLC
jgi:hypothetical protein